MIVVTGSTGHVGRLLAEELARRGVPMRLLVRDPARAPQLPGAEVVEADYGDPAALEAALDEGDRVFMVSLTEPPERRIPLHRGFIEAGARRGVAQIAYLSFVNAGPDAIFLHGRSHGATEEMLERSGVAWTSIRNGMYGDVLPTWFEDDGAIRVAGEEGRLSFSYRPELAEAIAVVLTEPGHENTVYNITGPEAVTMTELAEIATEVTGDSYRYEPWPDERWASRWRAGGRPDWRIESGLTSYAALRAGELDVVADDYRRITGREPLTVAGVIERHREEMPLSAARATGRTT